MHRQRHQLDAQRRAHAAHGIEARLRVRPQGLVQRLAGEAGSLGNLGHAAGAGDGNRPITGWQKLLTAAAFPVQDAPVAGNPATGGESPETKRRKPQASAVRLFCRLGVPSMDAGRGEPSGSRVRFVPSLNPRFGVHPFESGWTVQTDQTRRIMSKPVHRRRRTPLVVVHDHHAVTTRQAVAEDFGKRHDHILERIENLKAECPPEFNAPNFRAVEYIDAKGEKRPAYELTRDGFTLLAMGFTGPKALQFKIAYIERFNSMEARLLAKKQPRIASQPVALPAPATARPP